MSLREPCHHGRWERHHFGELSEGRCPGGRILTDAEALRRLLYDQCENPRCDNCELIRFDTSMKGTSEPIRTGDPCPACGGSGRTPKNGVEPLDMATNGIAEDGEPGFWFPASMLDPERNS